MAIREIIIIPDKQLRLVSKPVETVNAEIRKLADDDRIETGVANAVVAASSAATGGRSGAAATKTLTEAEAVPPWPSSIVYVKRSVPEKPGAGVYVIVAPVAETLPFAGAVTPLIVSGSPSGSLSFASTLIATGVANAVVAASSTATGGRFGCGSTVTLTAALAVPPRPSLIVYVKRSVPEKPAAGV